MKPSLLPLFASLLSAASLLAQDAPPPQPPHPPQPLSGTGERSPHQLDLPPGDAPRPQQRRRPNAPQPTPAVSPRAIANIEQMARAKEAEGHPDEAMELRQLIGSLHSPQGPRQANRPQPSQPFPAVPNGPGLTAPSRPDAAVHQQLQSLQRQLMILRNEVNTLRHQPSKPPVPHADPHHSPETLKRIAKAHPPIPHSPPADKDGSIKEQIKAAVRDLLENRLANTGKPKKLKELRKDSPDVAAQRKSKKKPESKDAPKHDAPPESPADPHKKDAEHKEHDDHGDKPKADDHKEHDDHKEEHKGGEKEEHKEG